MQMTKRLHALRHSVTLSPPPILGRSWCINTLQLLAAEGFDMELACGEEAGGGRAERRALGMPTVGVASSWCLMALATASSATGLAAAESAVAGAAS